MKTKMQSILMSVPLIDAMHQFDRLNIAGEITFTDDDELGSPQPLRDNEPTMLDGHIICNMPLLIDDFRGAWENYNRSLNL